MKYFLFILFFPFMCFTQNKLTKTLKEKSLKIDTIFFKYEENYTLFIEDYKEYQKESYKVYEKNILKNHVNNTQGYFMFKKENIIYNLNPKKVFSLKKCVENEQFYYEGKYSKIININVLKEKIFKKYKVFIVNEDKFIAIRQHPNENFYYSFYPIRYQPKENYPPLIKDTLFIKYSKNMLTEFQYQHNKKINYKVKGTGLKDSGFMFLQEETELANLKPNKTDSLKQILSDSNFFYKKDIVDDLKLSNYLSNYILILKKDKKFIKLNVFYEIE